MGAAILHNFMLGSSWIISLIFHQSAPWNLIGLGVGDWWHAAMFFTWFYHYQTHFLGDNKAWIAVGQVSFVLQYLMLAPWCIMMIPPPGGTFTFVWHFFYLNFMIGNSLFTRFLAFVSEAMGVPGPVF